MSIPFPLKLITIIVIVLIILLIISIRRKKKGFVFPLLALIIFGIGFGIWKGLNEYNRKNEDLGNVTADIKIMAPDLIREYEANDTAANQKYLGKVIEITGNVKEIERDEQGYYTIILGDTTVLSSIRCSMDTVYNSDAAHLKAGSSAIVRGSCTGFNKDDMGLGSDVILNRCAVVQKKE